MRRLVALQESIQRLECAATVIVVGDRLGGLGRVGGAALRLDCNDHAFATGLNINSSLVDETIVANAVDCLGIEALSAEQLGNASLALDE